MFFRDVIGQESLKASLINSIKEERFPHAMLLQGSFGKGGLPLAIAFFRYLNCTNRQEEDACGSCPSCLKINQLGHPDLHFIFPHVARVNNKEVPSAQLMEEWRDVLLNENNQHPIINGYFSESYWEKHLSADKKQLSIPAIDSLEIIKKTTYKPYEGNYQAVVVWMPEKMNTSTANKVLKVLEEPPAKTIFLFVSESTELMLPTVLSRLQSIFIPPIHFDDLKLAVGRLYSIDSDSASYIATKSQGDVIEAYKQAGEDSSGLRSEFIKWMRYCYKIDYIMIREWVEVMSRRGRDEQVRFCNEALEIVRDCLILNYVDKEELLITQNNGSTHSQNEYQFLQKFSPFIHANNAQDIIALINDLTYHIQRNVYGQVAFMDVSLKMCKLLKTKV